MTFNLTATFNTPRTGSFLAHVNLIAEGVGSLRCHISDGTFQFNQTATITGPGSTTISTSQACTLAALGPDGSPPARFTASDFSWTADLSAFHTFGVSTVTDYTAVQMEGVHYVVYIPVPNPPDLGDQFDTTSTATCPAPGPGSGSSHPLLPRDDVTATNHLVGIAGDTKLAQGTYTMKCIPATAGGSCSIDYTITTPAKGQDWFKVTSPLKGTVTTTAPLTVSADPGKLSPAGSPYSAQFTITGNFKSSPKVVTILFDVLPPCAAKLTITKSFPQTDAVIWAAEVKAPRFLASMDYAAPFDTQVAIELVDGSDNLLNVGDSTATVKAGAGTVQLTMSPGPALRATAPTPVYLRAVFSTLGKDGSPAKPGDPPFRSDPIPYNLAPAPQLSMVAGCSDNGSFSPVSASAGAVPVLSDIGCWPAVQVTPQFLGPKQAQLTIDRAQFFGDKPRGDDLMPPRTVHPSDPPQVFTLTSRDPRQAAKTFARNYSELGAADRVLVRLLLHNPDTQQVVVSDPSTIGFDRVHIVGCVPDPDTETLKLTGAAIICVPEYSIWDEPLQLRRAVAVNGDLVNALAAVIKDLPPFASERFQDDPIVLPTATLPVSSPTVAYILTQFRTALAYDLVTYWRTAQSLDDAINALGRDKVADFITGKLQFLNGLGLPGKLGSVIKQAADICGGAGQGFNGKKLVADALLTLSNKKTDCVTKLEQAYSLLVGKNSASRQAAVPPGVVSIGATWAFDNPIPKGAGFQADLTLNYSADQLPDRPDFVESQMQIISYDPAAGAAELLPTTLDTKAKTATTHLDHLAPFYSLAMVAPLSKTLLRSPLLLAGSDLSSGVAVENLGSGLANAALAAYAGDGTSLGNAATPPSLQIPASAQKGGLASDLFGSGAQQVADSLQLTVDQPAVAGAQVLAGAGLLDILPLESAANNTWVLSLIEQNDLYGTQVHVANNSNFATSVQFDLRGPDGVSVGAYNTGIEAKGKVTLGPSTIFPGLQTPFTGYLVVSAGQDITTAALLLSRTAVAAVAGKIPPAATGAGKLYGPMMGGDPYAIRLNLVNLGASSAALVIHAYSADGTEAAPAVNVTLDAMQQYTKNLPQLFSADPGAVSLVIETSSQAVVGDVVLSDATPADRYRASIPLTTMPQTSLVIPYVAGDGTTVTSLSLSNAGKTAATAKLTLFSPNGSQAGSTTAKLAVNASYAGVRADIFSGAAAGAYITISSDQPVTAMTLIDPGVRDVAAVVGVPIPGLDIGAAAAPSIVTTATLDFGSVAVGQTKDLTLAVGNSGNNNLTVSALTVNGSAFRVTSPSTPFTVAAGAPAKAVTVRFTPAAVGAVSGTIAIASNDPVRPTVSVPISGTGATSTTTAPSISVTPTSLAYGSVTVGQTKDMTVTVANTGNAGLAVSAMTLSGAGFTLVGPTAPLAVAAGASMVVTVRFAPAAAGVVGGTLTIASNDPAKASTTVSLTGTGITGAPVINVSPVSLTFGTVTIGQPKDLALTLSNKGTAPLVVGSITSDNTQFAAVTAAPTVAPGASATVTVRFTPNVAAAQSGALTIASNDPVAPSTKIPLTGTGATSSSSDVTLSVDGGTFINAVGYPNGAPQAFFVNILTPPSYPATLKSVQIYFGNRSDGLKSGTPIQIVTGVSGGVLGMAPATIPAVGAFNDYTVAPITINSGDFVVGFEAQNPAGILPADLDQTSPSKRRSYTSNDGATYNLLDSSPGAGGNLGIRAVVTTGR
jgi:hypothetical protein